MRHRKQRIYYAKSIAYNLGSFVRQICLRNILRVSSYLPEDNAFLVENESVYDCVSAVVTKRLLAMLWSFLLFQ
jgi:hypothetical protein